jgi:tetratricopeptide (TPR) repeat protein
LWSFTKSIEIDPTFKFAFYNQGLTYQNLNKVDESIKSLEKCLEIDAFYLPALKLTAEIYEK